MKNKTKYILSFLLFSATIFGQIPGDWTVNPHDFEHYATVTAEIYIGDNATDTPYTLAAFQNTSCRGIAEGMTVEGHLLYYLMVYSNDPGETIHFNLYSPEQDTVLNCSETISFTSGQSFGETDSPFHLSVTNYLSVTTRPVSIQLSQNYPNPFNPETRIHFSVKESCDLELTIFNSAGKRVKIFSLENTSPGEHVIIWDATNDANEALSSGIYFYQLQGATVSSSRKMLYLK